MSESKHEKPAEVLLCVDCDGSGLREVVDWRDGEAHYVEIGCRTCLGHGFRARSRTRIVVPHGPGSRAQQILCCRCPECAEDP